MAKSKSYDQAVANARGETVTTTTDAPIVEGGNISLMLSTTTQEELAALVASGDYDVAPNIVNIEEGQTLTGLLEGNGIDAEITDRDTGEVKMVKTWILSSGPMRVSILSSAQLEKKLPPFVGGVVKISRGKDKKFHGGNYTEYLVMGPKRPDGTARNWATRPQLTTGNENK